MSSIGSRIRRATQSLAGFLIVSTVFAAVVRAGDPPSSPQSKTATSEKPAAASASSPLDVLATWLGAWKVVERHYDRKGGVVAVVEGTEENLWTLDEKALRRQYGTKTGTQAFKALGLLTWNDVERKFHGVWFDNASSAGPVTIKGDWEASTQTMVFDAESSGKDRTAVRYRVVERWLDKDRRLATTYLHEGKDVIKTLEVEYVRAEPCPEKASGTRIILDGIEKPAEHKH